MFKTGFQKKKKGNTVEILDFKTPTITNFNYINVVNVKY